MLNNFKARLRAWLMGIVREAVRLELRAKVAAEPPIPAVSVKLDMSKPVGQGVMVVDQAPSFEQMQDESLRELRKFHEVKK